MYLNLKDLVFYIQKHKNLVIELIFMQKIRCLLPRGGPTFSVKLGPGPGFSGGGQSILLHMKRKLHILESEQIKFI